MPRRSPVIFWLLLAATVAVDAVVFSWISREKFPAPIFIKLAYEALIISQVGIVCTWSALASKKILWIPALLAPLVAAFIAPIFSDDPVNYADQFKLYVAIYGLFAALVLVGLWILRSTSYWRRRTGNAYELQYSLAQLLVAMTVAAVLATTMRGGPFVGDGGVLSFGLIGSFAALTVWSAFAWSWPLHWLLRLAAVCGVALAFGGLFWLAADFGRDISLAFAAHYLIQAIVLSAWLGWGTILPLNETVAGERESPTPLTSKA